MVYLSTSGRNAKKLMSITVVFEVIANVGVSGSIVLNSNTSPLYNAW